MIHFYLWIYIIFFIFLKFSYSTLNEAPAKVTLRFQISKLNQAPANESRLRVCVDKRNESCFWLFYESLQWDGDQYKEISIEFLIDNLAVELTFNLMIEKEKKNVDFPKKSINLKTLSSKRSLELHAFSLESFITFTIDYECENGYYPPRQCTKECNSVPRVSDCDGFGNKICKEGLLYNAQIDDCVANNCLKSHIRCDNGQCVNNGKTIKCVCFEGYYGKICNYRNTCHPNPCLNGGQCTFHKNNMSYTCLCLQQFAGMTCQFLIKNKCLCPQNMECAPSENGGPNSCISKIFPIDQNNYKIVSVEPINNNDKGRSLESKKDQELRPISQTTTLIAAVGCLMLLLCICISFYVFYFTREHNKDKRNNNAMNSPSTLYTDLIDKSKATSFKRSLSLDDNSAYMPSNSHMLQTLPNNFTMGSSNGYSLHTNSYQDNPSLSLQHFPVLNGYVYRQEYPLNSLVFHQNCKKNESSCSTTSRGSSVMPPVMPPVLPPRVNNSETSPLGTLPNFD